MDSRGDPTKGVGYRVRKGRMTGERSRLADFRFDKFVRSAKSFVDEDSCNGRGQCAGDCQASAIFLRGWKAVWTAQCLRRMHGSIYRRSHFVFAGHSRGLYFPNIESRADPGQDLLYALYCGEVLKRNQIIRAVPVLPPRLLLLLGVCCRQNVVPAASWRQGQGHGGTRRWSRYRWSRRCRRAR